MTEVSSPQGRKRTFIPRRNYRSLLKDSRTTKDCPLSFVFTQHRHRNCNFRLFYHFRPDSPTIDLELFPKKKTSFNIAEPCHYRTELKIPPVILHRENRLVVVLCAAMATTRTDAKKMVILTQFTSQEFQAPHCYLHRYRPPPRLSNVLPRTSDG